MPDNKQEPKPNGEELESTQVAELEGLIAERDEALAAKEQRIAELEQALSEKDEQLAALTQSAAELEQKLAEREESLAQAITSYRALIVKYNSGDYTATIQLSGSYKVYLQGIAVARNIPAAEMALGRKLAVIFFDEHNAKDAVVVGVYSS